MAFGDIRPVLKPQERKRKIAAGYSSGVLHFLSLSRMLGLVLALRQTGAFRGQFYIVIV